MEYARYCLCVSCRIFHAASSTHFPARRTWAARPRTNVWCDHICAHLDAASTHISLLLSAATKSAAPALSALDATNIAVHSTKEKSTNHRPPASIKWRAAQRLGDGTDKPNATIFYRTSLRESVIAACPRPGQGDQRYC
jgi:hypothetical protein